MFLNAFNKVAIENIPQVSGANPPTFEMPEDKRHEWAVKTSKSYPLWRIIFFCLLTIFACNKFYNCQKVCAVTCFGRLHLATEPLWIISHVTPHRNMLWKVPFNSWDLLFDRKINGTKNYSLTCGGAKKANWVASFKVWVKFTALYCVDRNTWMFWQFIKIANHLSTHLWKTDCDIICIQCLYAFITGCLMGCCLYRSLPVGGNKDVWNVILGCPHIIHVYFPPVVVTSITAV